VAWVSRAPRYTVFIQSTRLGPVTGAAKCQGQTFVLSALVQAAAFGISSSAVCASEYRGGTM